MPSRSKSSYVAPVAVGCGWSSGKGGSPPSSRSCAYANRDAPLAACGVGHRRHTPDLGDRDAHPTQNCRKSLIIEFWSNRDTTRARLPGSSNRLPNFGRSRECLARAARASPGVLGTLARSSHNSQRRPRLVNSPRAQGGTLPPHRRVRSPGSQVNRDQTPRPPLIGPRMPQVRSPSRFTPAAAPHAVRTPAEPGAQAGCGARGCALPVHPALRCPPPATGWLFHCGLFPCALRAAGASGGRGV